jgi:RNA polymerase sigma-70 factor (ECF subfamily)
MGMESVRGTSAEELLRHQAFVRRLAHELVSDAARADDIVQDAWVQALRSPPCVAAAARGWFRAVVRNLASRAARQEERRSSRELAVARSEAAAPAEIGERLALEQRLVQAVEALREPYRSAVFLRYFEELSPRAIAARERVPVATVKTRLRRALELLREALDRSHGRRAWALALARLARPEHLAVPVAAPLFAAGCALAGATLWWLGRAPDGRGVSPELAALAAEPAVEPAPAEVDMVVPEPPAATPRVILDASETDAPETAESAPPDRAREAASAEPAAEEPLRLLGRVLFPDSRGVPGASVVLGPFSTTSDARGRFELVLDLEGNVGRPEFPWSLDELDGDTALVAIFDGWVPAVRERAGELVHALQRRDELDGSGPVEVVELVLESLALSLSGTLLDRTGAPAEGWRISLLDGTPAFRGPYRPFTVEELASGARAHVETGADGGFAFRGLSEGKEYRVRAWNERTLEQVVSAPIPAGTAGVVVRAPDEPWRTVVDGVVVGLDGSPLAGVRCRLTMAEYELDGGTWMTTGQEVETDALGRFAFADVPPTEIFIRFNGYGSGARLDLVPDDPCRALRVELVRTGEFLFEARDPARAPDALGALDEAGERLKLEVPTGEGSTSSTSELEVPESGSRRASVSELARWLVLLDDSRELARLPLAIRHGEVARIRW